MKTSASTPLMQFEPTRRQVVASSHDSSGIRALDAAQLVCGLLVLALFAQEGALAYSHVMYRAAEATPDVAYRGLILIAPLFALAAFVFCQHPCLTMPWGSGLLLTLFLITTVMSSAMAMTMCLQFNYFIGDALRFLAPWLTFFLSYQAFRLVRCTAGVSSMYWWFDALAWIAALDGLMTIGFGLTFFGYHISNWFYLYLIGYAILSDRHSELTTNVIIGITLLATVASHKRTNFALTAAALLLAIGWRIWHGKQILRLCVTLTGMLLAGAAANIVVSAVTGHGNVIEVCLHMYEDLSSTFVEKNHDASYVFRLNEVDNIKAYYQEHPMMSVFGIGFGGEVPVWLDAHPDSVTPSGNMHHVHIGHWLYFLRNGCVGLCLLALFAWISTVGLMTHRSSAPTIAGACAIYAATRVVASMGGNYMMEDLDLPLVVGLGLAFVDFGPANPAGSRVSPATIK